MKKIIIVSVLTVILSSCTWGESAPVGPTIVTNPPSPYPATTISGEIVPDTAPAKGEKYSAKGTEPFWSLEITPTETTLTRPGEKDTIVKKYETRQTDKGAIISIKDAKGEFFVTLAKSSCSDGMSETKYAYKASVLVGAETLTGCAMKK